MTFLDLPSTTSICVWCTKPPAMSNSTLELLQHIYSRAVLTTLSRLKVKGGNGVYPSMVHPVYKFLLSIRCFTILPSRNALTGKHDTISTIAI